MLTAPRYKPSFLNRFLRVKRAPHDEKMARKMLITNVYDYNSGGQQDTLSASAQQDTLSVSAQNTQLVSALTCSLCLDEPLAIGGFTAIFIIVWSSSSLAA